LAFFDSSNHALEVEKNYSRFPKLDNPIKKEKQRSLSKSDSLLDTQKLALAAGSDNQQFNHTARWKSRSSTRIYDLKTVEAFSGISFKKTCF